MRKPLQPKSVQVQPPKQMESCGRISFKSGSLDQSASKLSLATNAIYTTKYTIWTFIPFCLVEQCMRAANMYFIFIGILQIIPQLSTTGGIPVILMPLSFVMCVSMAKVAVEEYNRKKNDEEENHKQYMRIDAITNKRAETSFVLSKDIKVGDIIVVSDGMSFPADLMLLGVSPKIDGSSPPAFCHIETSNIDGETNLKVRMVPPVLNEIEHPLFTFEGRKSCLKAHTVDTIWNEFDMQVDLSHPHGDLDRWQGSEASITHKTDGKSTKEILELENLLSRGAMLQNSNCIFGLVVYTGRDCKVFKNGADSEIDEKFSAWESYMTVIVLVMACVMVMMCTVMAISTFIWTKDNADEAWYLKLGKQDPGLLALQRFFTWAILFSQCIPVSLMVCLETTRFIGAWIMQGDPKLAREYKIGDSVRKKTCNVQRSNMNEDLGRVQFVFSDKTGTLTENRLDFRRLLVAGNKSMGGGYTQIAWMNKLRSGEITNKNCTQDVQKLVMKFKISHVEAEAYLQSAGGDFSKAVSQVQEDISCDLPHVSFTHTARIEAQKLLKESLQNNSWNKLECADHPGSQYPFPEDDPALQMEIYFRALAFNNNTFPVHEDNGETLYNADTPDDVCFAWFNHFIGMQLTCYKKPFKMLEISLGNDERTQSEQWREIRLLKFTSKKKRMSVIMERVSANGNPIDDDRVYVFIKGADSAIESLADPTSLKYYKRHMSEQLQEYCEEGLRTLLLGYAVYSKTWWEKHWAGRFSQNLDDDALEELEIEFDESVQYQILGATAVEDKLQDEVPETISNLLAAGIRTWVLTGDKKETACNIGMACNLLTPEMQRSGKLYDITHENYLKVINHIDLKSSRSPSVKSSWQSNDEQHIYDDHIQPSSSNDDDEAAGLMISGNAIEEIFNQDVDVQEQFLSFALSCHSIVAYRLQPSQKARVVKAIKDSTGCITLAIGDGANDEAMIRVANIGVGIAGLEGTAAARASDYAISRFNMLNSLLFVHGRNAYYGTSYLVFYSIYKNVIHMFSVFWFAFFSGFSAQPLYLEMVFQMWNMIYTALPIFVDVFVDRDVADNVLLSNPVLYPMTNGDFEQSGIELHKDGGSNSKFKVPRDGGKWFNAAVFISWLFEAFLLATLVIHVLFKAFEDATSFTADGKCWGLQEVSIVIFTAYTLYINFMLIVKFTQWGFWHLVFMFPCTIFAYFLSLIVFNSMPFRTSGYDWTGIIGLLLTSQMFWYLVFWSVATCMLITQFISLINSLFYTSNLFQYRLQTKQGRRFCSCKMSCVDKVEL